MVKLKKNKGLMMMMPVKYQYMTKDGRKLGWFQCDLVDFKQFAKSRITADTDVECLILVISKKESWIWTTPSKNTKASGWQFTGSVFSECY